MIRRSHDGPVFLAGNFLMVSLLLSGCIEADEQTSSFPSAVEKKEQEKEKGRDEQEITQEIGPVEEDAVSGMEIGLQTTEVSDAEVYRYFLMRLQEEQWEMVLLEVKEAAEIRVPSDDFKEPHMTHAVLEKKDYSNDYTWLEINDVNEKFNTIWQKHWEKILAGSEDFEEGVLSEHLTSIQRKFETLLNQLSYMEFKNSTEYAQHLHDYKLYLEGAILYRMEAASAFLEALETKQSWVALVNESVEAAIESEAYARLAASELTNYENSF